MSGIYPEVVWAMSGPEPRMLPAHCGLLIRASDPLVVMQRLWRREMDENASATERRDAHQYGSRRGKNFESAGSARFL
jgi:hypothetical protein